MIGKEDTILNTLLIPSFSYLAILTMLKPESCISKPPTRAY